MMAPVESLELSEAIEDLEVRLSILGQKLDSNLETETDSIASDLRQLKQLSNKRWCTSSPSPFVPRLVIFDKDGTLVCFHTMWAPWCRSLARKLVHTTGMGDVSGKLYKLLGFDVDEERISCGPLAEDTHPQIRAKISTMLHEEKMLAPRMAEATVDAVWTDLVPGKQSIKTTCDVAKLFRSLKASDVKIAICTSDSRVGTEAFIKEQNLHNLVDMVVCGDDHFSKPKPSAHNALYICKALKVSPAQTVMVGDTPADTGMGCNAQLGLNVGVLTGIGGPRELQHADVLLQHVGQLDQLLIAKDFHNAIVTHRAIDKMAQTAKWIHEDQQLDHDDKDNQTRLASNRNCDDRRG